MQFIFYKDCIEEKFQEITKSQAKDLQISILDAQILVLIKKALETTFWTSIKRKSIGGPAKGIKEIFKFKD